MARSTIFKIVRSISITGGLFCVAIIFFLLTEAKQTSLAKPLSSSPPTLLLPQTDIFTGPIVMTAGAGGAWYHDTRIFTNKAYNVDVAGEGNVGLRVSYLGIDLTGLRLNFFPDAEDLNDWHFNRWEGGVQMGLCTADNLGPPPPQENVAMGPHMKNSAGTLIYVNPSPNQGGNTWWAPDLPGSYWDAADPVNSGYDVRPGHGQVVNYAGKGLYVFPGAPFTDPLEGDIVFTGEYDGFTSNHWYQKDSIVPHTEWVTGTPPTQTQIHAVNTFDMVIDYTPIIINGRTDYKRYKVEWWYRKHQSSAALEGGPSWWVPDVNDPSDGWIQPATNYWYFGGYAADGTLTGQDEPGFDFSAVFPYVSAFGWWRDDQPEQTIVVQQIVVEYIAGSVEPTANLSIDKQSSPLPMVPGEAISYTIVVSNSGPAAVNGAVVSDTLPGEMLNPTWRCTAASGATCTTQGNGNIHDTVNLPSNTTVTYVITGTLSSSTIATVVNMARVNPVTGVTELDSSDNMITTTTPINRRADLVIDKSSVRDSQLNLITYTIIVQNFGPSNADGITISDPVPAGVDSFTWQCRANGGAACTPSGTGDISDTLTHLPNGGQVMYTVTAILNTDATVVNTAAIINLPADLTNTGPNNSASDTSQPDNPTFFLPIIIKN